MPPLCARPDEWSNGGHQRGILVTSLSPAELCEGHVSPCCGPPDTEVGGLTAASEQHQAVEKVGRGHWTSASCC